MRPASLDTEIMGPSYPGKAGYQLGQATSVPPSTTETVPVT